MLTTHTQFFIQFSGFIIVSRIKVAQNANLTSLDILPVLDLDPQILTFLKVF